MGLAKYWLWLYYEFSGYFIIERLGDLFLLDRRAEIQQNNNRHLTINNSLNEKYAPLDFSKIRVGVKTLDDAVLSLG